MLLTYCQNHLDLLIMFFKICGDMCKSAQSYIIRNPFSFQILGSLYLFIVRFLFFGLLRHFFMFLAKPGFHFCKVLFYAISVPLVFSPPFVLRNLHYMSLNLS